LRHCRRDRYFLFHGLRLGLQFQDEIAELRAMEIEAIRERILPTYQQELSYLAEELKRVQTILRERDYGYVNTGPTLLVPEPPALAYRQKMSSASACQTTQPTPTRTCNPRPAETQSLGRSTLFSADEGADRSRKPRI
jgi:hypothetical protein